MFMIESTYNGRGILVEDGIASGTLEAGQLVALSAGEGKPTATSVTVTNAPDAVVVQGGATTTDITFARIFRGDVLVTDATKANGTDLSDAEVDSLVDLVGSQALRIATGAKTLDGVNTSGGKMELISFDSSNLKARVTIKP